MRTVFFHEDDYCQWEILPLVAKDFCLKQMRQIDEFAEKHHAKGIGFTDIYIGKDSPHNTKELNLRSKQLNEALAFLPAYDRVETGYSSYNEELTSIYSRGEQSILNVFWSVDEAGLVEAIWLDLQITPDIKELCGCILSALGKLSPVLLADWGWSWCVDLTSAEEIEKYITEKANNAINI